MMHKFLTVLSLVAILSGCCGKAANPVMIAQYGDREKSCDTLRAELDQIQSEIARLLPDTEKTGRNVALGVAGWFLIVPWFFMDFKNGEKTEYEALRQRYMHLSLIATERRCHIKTEKYPSVQEIEKKIEAAKKAAEAEKAKK